jgi:hypothetical protein
MIKDRYHAVGRETLISVLGAQCSPDVNRKGYVIGPDANGRFCHCATCFSLHEAKAIAKRLNDKLDEQ